MSGPMPKDSISAGANAAVCTNALPGRSHRQLSGRGVYEAGADSDVCRDVAGIGGHHLLARVVIVYSQVSRLRALKERTVT